MLLNAPDVESVVDFMMSNWLLVLGLFMGASWIADRWARSDVSLGMRYVGLGLYVIAEAFIFLPLMYVAAYYGDPSVYPPRWPC